MISPEIVADLVRRVAALEGFRDDVLAMIASAEAPPVEVAAVAPVEVAPVEVAPVEVLPAVPPVGEVA